MTLTTLNSNHLNHLNSTDAVLTDVKSHRLSITADGAVVQQVPVIVNSLCQLDVLRFPFDAQTCRLTFGSWAYDGLQLNLTSAQDPVDMTSFVPHDEWEVIGVTGQRVEPYYFGVPYPQVGG